MEKGQIVLCNLHLTSQSGKKIILKEVVFSQPYTHIKKQLIYGDIEDQILIGKTGLKENLIINKVDIISYHGFKHKNRGYTEAKANILGERNIAGGYD